MNWAQDRLSGMQRGSDGRPVAFHDVAKEMFPFTVQTFDAETDELLWEQTVHGPGVVEVPGFAPRKVYCAVTYLRTGERVVTDSEGQTKTNGG